MSSPLVHLYTMWSIVYNNYCNIFEGFHLGNIFLEVKHIPELHFCKTLLILWGESKQCHALTNTKTGFDLFFKLKKKILNVTLVLLDVELILTHPVISASQEIPVSV